MRNKERKGLDMSTYICTYILQVYLHIYVSMRRYVVQVEIVTSVCKKIFRSFELENAAGRFLKK